MKRFLLIVFVVLAVTPLVARAQMMGGGMSGNAPTPASAQLETQQQMPASGKSAGMMGQGMMAGMMGQGKGMMGDGCMMQGGMMGPEMMGSMMSSMMDGMMPGKTRGCMMMAEGMMKGQVDLAQMRKGLALSDEQAERLRTGLRPFQKEAILTLASLKVAELELSDLLAAEKVDFGKVEAKLKEIEAVRTKARLVHLKAAEAVKVILSREQLEKLQAVGESAPPPVQAVPQKGAVPQAGSGHEQHH